MNARQHPHHVLFIHCLPVVGKDVDSLHVVVRGRLRLHLPVRSFHWVHLDLPNHSSHRCSFFGVSYFGVHIAVLTPWRLRTAVMVDQGVVGIHITLNGSP